jgi:hypothetical protein
VSGDLQALIEAALVVLVPEVDPIVAPFRQKYDFSAVLGVPAHITINYPFLPGIAPNEKLHRELEELFAMVKPFQCTFNRIARLPDLLYLPPDPATPFIQLITLVADHFPESPPYEGAFDEIIPHLTVAQSEDEEALESVEQELAVLSLGILPLSIQVERAWLIDHRAGKWQLVRSYPLGQGRGHLFSSHIPSQPAGQ